MHEDIPLRPLDGGGRSARLGRDIAVTRRRETRPAPFAVSCRSAAMSATVRVRAAHCSRGRPRLQRAGRDRCSSGASGNSSAPCEPTMPTIDAPGDRVPARHPRTRHAPRRTRRSRRTRAQRWMRRCLGTSAAHSSREHLTCVLAAGPRPWPPRPSLALAGRRGAGCAPRGSRCRSTEGGAMLGWPPMTTRCRVTRPLAPLAGCRSAATLASAARSRV